MIVQRKKRQGLGGDGGTLFAMLAGLLLTGTSGFPDDRHWYCTQKNPVTLPSRVK